MSYDISLRDKKTGEIIEFDKPHEFKGGTFTLGGSNRAWLNITYNYSEFYKLSEPEFGIRAIYDKTGLESIPILQSMINAIMEHYPKLEFSDNYWDPLSGNAILPLFELQLMALMAPDAIWKGD